MQKDSNKIAILVSNYFKSFQFDEALKNLPNVSNVDVISSETGKIKSWDKTEKEYHTVVLYTNNLHEVRPMNYGTIIIHKDLMNGQSCNKETVSFINQFMGRLKPIVAVCQNEWTIISGSKIDKAFDLTNVSNHAFQISA